LTKIDNFSFGSIVIDGKKYHHDVVILPNGTVRKRRGMLRSLAAHSFRKNEIEKLSEAEVIILGTGTNGRAHISPEAQSYAQETKLELLPLPSYDAVGKLNQLIDEGKKVGAIIHITC
jgi:hypothetical protein